MPSAGTDHALFRLGDEWVVRLPRRAEAASQAEKEQRWLPRLAPQLPLAVPAPVACGAPGEGYPWPWSVCRWIEGEDAAARPLRDLGGAARDLAAFALALQRCDARGAPASGAHNHFRGVPLAARDALTRAALARLGGELDEAAGLRAWQAALAAPCWRGAPVWLHGDLHPGNLVVAGGRVVAVIDFGLLGAGDPACDAMLAWSVLSAETRDAFRATLAPDAATWTRARGWALSVSAIALDYYRGRNEGLAAISRRTLAAVLADSESEA